MTLVQIGDYSVTPQGAKALLSPGELSSAIDSFNLAFLDEAIGRHWLARRKSMASELAVPKPSLDEIQWW